MGKEVWSNDRGELKENQVRGLVADLFVVYEVGDGGILTAEGAVDIASGFDFSKGHIQSIIHKQSALESPSFAENDLESFDCLDGPDGSGDTAEHPSLLAVGNRSRRRWLAENAAVAGSFSWDDGSHLAVKAEDGPMNQRFSRHNTGVVYQKACGKVVGTVNDDIIIFDEIENVFRGKPEIVGNDLGSGIEGPKLLLSRSRLRPSHIN